MPENYCVVAYLRGELGEFVNQLRRRLSPKFAGWLAHVTILPPRPLEGHLEQILEQIRRNSRDFKPFEATLGPPLTFWPANGVVYLSFSQGADHLVQLHEMLNCNGLARAETYPYVPHITIAQDLDEGETRRVLDEVTTAWSRFSAPLSFRLTSLVLVRQVGNNHWADLAAVPLGSHYRSR